MSGRSATTSFRDKISKADVALTFYDVILLPGWAEVEPRDVSVVTRVTASYSLNLPFVSSPMDTVTESELAIAMARYGGLGVLHRNCTVEEQVAMAKAVKEAEPTADPASGRAFPNAARDGDGRLFCAAALSPFDRKRARELDRYADILVADVAHFHNYNAFEAMRKIVGDVSADVVVGNIGTYEAAVDSLTMLEGIAGFRVGIGSGSICTTTEVTKAGSPTLYAVAQVADAVRDQGSDVPIIADGGVRTPGDIAIALAAGASAVMMGNIFARCREAPGEISVAKGKRYKRYRGMASPSAMARRFILDRYGVLAPTKGISEGVEGWVPYRGELSAVIEELTSGLKAAMGYAGARDIRGLQGKARFAVLTPMGAREARPHDILLSIEDFGATD